MMLVAETFGYFVAVKFDGAAAPQIGGAQADGCFKREEPTGFSSYGPTIRRYLLIVNECDRPSRSFRTISVPLQR